MTPVDDAGRRERLRDALVAWGRTSLRETPWRRTRDPWLVLVSETMLQQTQVDRVLPRFERFVARFPTPAACSSSSVGEVIRAWEGLGYNRRAVALHRTATEVVERHDGQVPVALDQLLALPGVGPYTARAVRVFAHGCTDAVVDVNVQRVLRRAVVGRALTPKAAQKLADELVRPLAGRPVPTGDAADPGEVWIWNQAVMELGARHCRKRSPRCASCPVLDPCRWAGDGPDPAADVGTSQSRFDGSDRQGRGRLVAAVRRSPVPVQDVARVTGWVDRTRTDAVVAGLVADGLVTIRDGVLRLPDVHAG